MFIALDMSDTIVQLALCDGQLAGRATNPAWPVRVPVREMAVSVLPADTSPVAETRPTAAADCFDGIGAPAKLLVALARRHRLDPDTFVLGLGGRAGTLVCDLAQQAGIHSVRFVSRQFAIVAGNIWPADEVREYHRELSGEALDPACLREAFVCLMEKAADALQSQRLDQDDALLERYVDLRTPGAKHAVTVIVESLTDPAWLRQSCHEACILRGLRSTPEQPIEMLAAHLRCAIQRPETFWSPSDSSANAAGPPRPSVETASRQQAADLDPRTLPVGTALRGPMMFHAPCGAIHVPAGWSCEVEAGGLLWARHPA